MPIRVICLLPTNWEELRNLRYAEIEKRAIRPLRARSPELGAVGRMEPIAINPIGQDIVVPYRVSGGKSIAGEDLSHDVAEGDRL